GMTAGRAGSVNEGAITDNQVEDHNAESPIRSVFTLGDQTLVKRSHYSHPFLVNTRLPNRSRCTVQLGGTTTVVSGSSIIIGPRSAPVSAKRLRNGVLSNP